MTLATCPLRLGYVLGRFPWLSQSFVLNEIRALERVGHRVTVFSLVGPDEKAYALMPTAMDHRVQFLESSRGWDVARAVQWSILHHPLRLVRTIVAVARARDSDLWRFFKAALLIARQGKDIDHFHAHLRRGTHVVWMVHRLTGRGYSFSAHAGDLFVPAKARYVREELTTADFAVTVCESNRKLLARLQPRSTDKIHVIRPFLDQALFLAGEPDQASDTRPGLLRLVSVSRLVPKKGVVVLLEALHLLNQRGIPVQTTIIGEGPERANIEAMIYRLGLSKQVSLPGARDAAGVRALLLGAECFALASIIAPNGDADATPTVLGEAMALGLPVISTRLSGIPEIVPEGAGMLVESGATQALADAIAAIAALSPEQRRAMGDCGRAYVRANWNPDQDAVRLTALFEQAVLRRAGAEHRQPSTDGLR